MKMPNNLGSSGKIKQSEHIFAVKIKTESNGMGVLKTLLVMLLIFLQATIFIASNFILLQVFRSYSVIAIVLTLITCVFVLSSEYNGQAKATWILFLFLTYSFGYIFFFLSDKRILLLKSRKKFNKINEKTKNLQKQIDLTDVKEEVKTNCNYLYNTGNFVTYKNSKTKYFSSGTQLFDSILEDLEKAKEFIFIEYFIISNGVLLNRVLDILKQKDQHGVDVRIIYDDMGSHSTLKRKTKKQIISSGIKLQDFNRLVPALNLALNLRDHRKIVVIDGKISYTGGANLADEYVNEKRLHGYWKDTGIKIEGRATDNLTLSFLKQWEFLTKEDVNYEQYLNKAKEYNTKNIVVPFVTNPHSSHSIAKNAYANEIANAKEKIYIMTPYFIPDETIINMLINKAISGVDVKIILPDVADKKFVYFVSRSNAEKLLDYGIKVYTMTSSFVHSKVMLTENSAIVGSINIDLRSFNQQFESAVYTDEESTLKQIDCDFINTINHSEEVTIKNKKRNSFWFRILAGLFNLVSPFM